MSANSVRITATITGPLFGPLTPERLLLRGMTTVVANLAEDVRQRITPGPGRYGHVSEQIQSEVTTQGPRVLGRIFPRGKAAFRMVFLERGTRAHLIQPRGRRRRRATRRATRRVALAIGANLFRASVRHPGMAAQRPLASALAEAASDIPRILGEDLVRELRGMG